MNKILPFEKDNLDRYIILFGLMMVVLYLVLQFVLMAGDRAKMEKEIRQEYQKLYDDAKANMTYTVVYGCVYNRWNPEGYWNWSDLVINSTMNS